MARSNLFALCVIALAGAVAVPSGAVGPDPATETPPILLSRQLMESRGLRSGDVVRLAAKPSGERSRTFRIVGMYEPTPDPMRFAQRSLDARLHLPDLLALTSDRSDSDPSETVGSINVALADASDAPAFARDLAARVPGLTATPTSAPNDRTSTFIVIERFHLAVASVTMMGSAVFLLALMMMLVDERRETAGILRLIGFTRRRILMQVFVEGTLIAAAGTLFGVLFAIAAQGAFNRFFQWRYDTTLVFLDITPGVVAQSVLLAVPLGIGASVIASWTLLRRRPLALLKR
jgi:ABC-type lipoprotein release transport system permease subunit